MAPVVTWSMV